MFIIHSAWGVIDEVWDGSYWLETDLERAIALGLKLISQEIEGEYYDDEGVDPYAIRQAIDAGDFARANELYTEWCRYNKERPATVRILEVRAPSDDGTRYTSLVDPEDLKLKANA